ncbi:MAG: protein phosphatase 2C domain-containing protein [Pseudomonadota bacterium]
MDNPASLVSAHKHNSLGLRGSGMTHVGRVRRLNEDAILTDPLGVLWAVADGMGGYGNGDVASDIVIDCLSQMPDTGEPLRLLTSYLHTANEKILARGAELGTSQMGATAVAAVFEQGAVNIAWVGDSRAYLMRAAEFTALTHDHTVVQELLDQGLIEIADAKNHIEAHVVTRAVGAEPMLDVDLVTVPIQRGDRLILCSDGLTTCLSDAEIGRIARMTTAPEETCERLVRAALEAGAPDNVSVIAVFADAD